VERIPAANWALQPPVDFTENRFVPLATAVLMPATGSPSMHVPHHVEMVAAIMQLVTPGVLWLPALLPSSFLVVSMQATW
jgi:hypothetical protein